MREKPPILELRRSVLTKYKEYPLLWVAFTETLGKDYNTYVNSGQLVSLVRKENGYALVSIVDFGNDIEYEHIHAEGLTLEGLKDFIYKNYRIRLVIK